MKNMSEATFTTLPCYNCGSKRIPGLDDGITNEPTLFCVDCGFSISIEIDEKAEDKWERVCRLWDSLWEMKLQLDKLVFLEEWTQTVRRYQKEKELSDDNPFYSAVEVVEGLLSGELPHPEDMYRGMLDSVSTEVH